MTDSENVSISTAIEETRRLSVEATVVRILKARKIVKHNDLVAEVTKQLSSRFPCTLSLIKKRIESLIERDYINRDPNEYNLYHYMA